MKITREVRTLADLREVLDTCDRLDLDDDAEVVARVRFGLGADGAPLRDLTVRPARGRA